jgi:hypothetical protein
MASCAAMDFATRLRRTSDDFLARLDELESLEQEKRKLEPGSAPFRALAERVKDLSRELFHASQVQQVLGEETADLRATASPDAPATPIERIEPRDPSVILAEWRELERRLSETPVDSAEADRLRTETDRLRVEYRVAFQARQQDRR